MVKPYIPQVCAAYSRYRGDALHRIVKHTGASPNRIRSIALCIGPLCVWKAKIYMVSTYWRDRIIGSAEEC